MTLVNIMCTDCYQVYLAPGMTITLQNSIYLELNMESRDLDCLIGMWNY